MWWKVNEGRFPGLAPLAQRYLCIPATEVPCERIFSAAGLTISRLRASLDPDTADKLLFLNKNGRCYFNSTYGTSDETIEVAIPMSPSPSPSCSNASTDDVDDIGMDLSGILPGYSALTSLDSTDPELPSLGGSQE